MRRVLSTLIGGLLALLVLVTALVPVALGFLMGTQSGTAWVLQTLPAWVPGRLQFGEYTGTLAGGLAVKAVSWRHDRIDVAIDSARLVIHWWDLLDGRVGIDDLMLVGTRIHWRSDPQAQALHPNLPEPPVPVHIARLQVRGLEVQVDDAQPVMLDRINLEGSWQASGLTLDALDIEGPIGRLAGQGEIQGTAPFELTGEFAVALPLEDWPELAADVTLEGSLEAPSIDLAVAEPYQASVRITVDTKGSFRFEAPFDVTLSRLRTTWPDVRLRGDLAGTGGDAGQGLELGYRLDTKLDAPDPRLDGWQISARGDASTRLLRVIDFSVSGPALAELSAHGEIDLQAVDRPTRVEATWKDLRWPGEDPGRVLSESGSITVEGTLAAAAIDLRAVLQGQAVVAGTATIQWQDQLTVGMDLAGEKIDPAAFWTAWPGVLNGNLRARATWNGGSVPGAVEVEQLAVEGSLRERPVNLTGSGNWTRDSWQIDLFEGGYGSSRGVIRAAGPEPLRIDAQISAIDLGEWSSGWKGVLQLDTQVRGDALNPALDLTLAGKGLSSGDAIPIDLDARLKGQLGKHEGSLHLSGSQLSLDGHWQGRARREGVRLEDYAFQISQLTATVEGLSWALVSGGRGQWRRGNYALDQTCLKGGDASACLSGKWAYEGKEKGTKGEGAFRLANVSLEQLIGRMTDVVQLQGEADLTGRWRYDQKASVPWQPAFELTTSPLRLLMPESESDETDEGNDPIPIAPLVFSMTSGSRGPWRLSLSQPVVEGMKLSGEVTMVPLDSDWGASAISGVVQADWSDLASLEPLFPEVTGLGGRIEGRLRLGGTLSRPILDGDLELLEGRARLPESGLRLTDVTGEVSLVSLLDSVSRRLDLTGRATSGDGTLTLEGTLAWNGSIKSAEGTGRIYGENFRFFNTDLAQIVASPDLRLHFGNGLIDLGGDIFVPDARIRIPKKPVSAVLVSPDQRIDGSELEPQQKLYALKADVNVKFGDAVKFSGMGLDASLGGSLRLRQKDGETTANGSIVTKSGSYEAYGQKLAINRGRLLWSDTPLTSPALNVDASRSPTRDVTVGLRASGPLARPVVTLYSVPGMPQSDQLAYLLFGRPLQSPSTGETSAMNQAALALGVQAGNFLTARLGNGFGLDQVGVEVPTGADNQDAALVLGKFLTPDLYVSYGVSLLRALSTLKIEYVLSQRFRVETESSAERNSADVFLTLERD